MIRTFKHAVTGRAIRVVDDSRTARLVEADGNWSEIKPKSTSTKEADDGSGNAGGRGSGTRKSAQRKRGNAGSKPAR